jgi:ferredoxin
MADRNLKSPENVPGRYYVDNTCIDCDLCRQLAPRSFTRNDDGGYSYVYHQPETAEEVAAAEEARESCPTETIGDDGEGASAEEISAMKLD